MRLEEQLNRWVTGDSVHNNETDECCPDFSCCNDKMDTPIEVRKRFQQAVLEEDHRTQHEMLMMFLSEALEMMGKSEEVYIAGQIDDTAEIH
jgi:hypothetical protein